ncbi:MAG: orotate phosphoribosyltransferase [Magnetococcales bacterium]|nr:orotate phosphoribosyltransferase [Magnetococcales bacterium]
MTQTTTAENFLDFAIQANVLRFGTFQTKAGRASPYFFNAGLFHDGARLDRLGRFYAATLVDSQVPFDMLFGPAYKGIPLAATTAIALSRDHGINIPFAYNRKETKDHGEGGTIIGAPLKGKVMVVDDVISAGTSIRESVNWIQQAGATLAGVVIALDRQERGTGTTSATQEIASTHQVPVIAIARLADLIRLLGCDPANQAHLQAIQAYRDRWGVDGSENV